MPCNAQAATNQTSMRFGPLRICHMPIQNQTKRCKNAGHAPHFNSLTPFLKRGKKKFARARCAGLSFLLIERKRNPNLSTPPQEMNILEHCQFPFFFLRISKYRIRRPRKSPDHWLPLRIQLTISCTLRALQPQGPSMARTNHRCGLGHCASITGQEKHPRNFNAGSPLGRPQSVLLLEHSQHASSPEVQELTNASISKKPLLITMGLEEPSARRCNQNSCENIRRRSTCACFTHVCAGKQFYYRQWQLHHQWCQ